MSNKLKIILIVVVALILFNPISLEAISNYIDNSFEYRNDNNNKVYYVENENIYLKDNIDNISEYDYPYYNLISQNEATADSKVFQDPYALS